MRSILITFAILIMLILGFFKFKWGLICFNWITFMRPQSLDAWGFWNSKPVFQIAVILLFLSACKSRMLKVQFNPFTILLIIFYFWILLSTFFSVYPEFSKNWFKLYYLALIPTIILVSFCIPSVNDLKICIIAMAGSIMLLAAKVGLSNALHGGGRITEQIDGFVGDNNCFGLSICLALGMMLGLRTMFSNKTIKTFITVAIGFSILTILFTQSRGAFATLAIIFLFGILSSKRPVLNLILTLCIVLLGYMFLPKSMFSRLDTINNLENDSSASGRFEMWKRAHGYANSHPVFGLGIGCFRAYNANNSPPPHLVTHSVYFQVLSELGYIGLFLYLLLLMWSIYNLHRVYIDANCFCFLFPEMEWIKNTTFWMRNALIGYIFGSAFLDMLVYDIPWYTMLYGSMFSNFMKSYKSELEMCYAEQEDISELTNYNT